VLNVLSGRGGHPAWVTPEAGENWIAAGIQFRSFELVLGRALVVVEFGKEFEIALLGLASVTLPQGAIAGTGAAGGKAAYAYAELQIEVVLKPDDGIFAATAFLTPNSFLLTRDCHLVGGFAFFLWFGNSPHDGDFVVTLGGYHPAFTPPQWYPKVANIGLNWPVSRSVVIKGGVYFALTPTAAMAGGSLQVLFQSGDLRAWLTADVNIMIRWKPFYITAYIGVSVGVSFRLDLLFTTVTISVELGASLRLWGRRPAVLSTLIGRSFRSASLLAPIRRIRRARRWTGPASKVCSPIHRRTLQRPSQRWLPLRTPVAMRAPCS
jgi:hypothetical protein